MSKLVSNIKCRWCNDTINEYQNNKNSRLKKNILGKGEMSRWVFVNGLLFLIARLGGDFEKDYDKFTRDINHYILWVCII